LVQAGGCFLASLARVGSEPAAQSRYH